MPEVALQSLEDELSSEMFNEYTAALLDEIPPPQLPPGESTQQKRPIGTNVATPSPPHDNSSAQAEERALRCQSVRDMKTMLSTHLNTLRKVIWQGTAVCLNEARFTVLQKTARKKQRWKGTGLQRASK